MSIPTSKVEIRCLTPAVLLVAALGVLASHEGTARADTSIYVVGASNEFGTLDLSTGDFTQLGVFPPTTSRKGPFPIFGLGFTGPGQLSAVDSRGDLFSIDPANGAEIPPFSATSPFSTGTFPNGSGGDGHGNLYVFDTGTGNVDALNVTNMTVTPIVNFANTQSTGFTAVGPDGSLYITVLGSNPSMSYDDIYKIDPNTGAVVDLGADANNLWAGVFVGSTLYGFSATGGIDTINTVTGQETSVGTYSLPDGDAIYAAAFQAQSVPEPSTLVLACLAILGVAAGMKRRHSWGVRRGSCGKTRAA